jgi:hypothetical protein
VSELDDQLLELLPCPLDVALANQLAKVDRHDYLAAIRPAALLNRTIPVQID